jgi:hypothetical protein
MEMMRLRREESLSSEQIAQRLGTALGTVRAEMTRLRGLGFDIPGDSYAEARGLAGRAAPLTVEARPLGRLLASRGIALPEVRR